MKVLVFIPGILCSVYVQYLGLRQRCLSEEFGSLSSCKPEVCVSKSPLRNRRRSDHLGLYLWSTSTSLTYDGLLWWCQFHCVCYSHTCTCFSLHPAVFSLGVWWGDTNWMITEVTNFLNKNSRGSQPARSVAEAWPRDMCPPCSAPHYTKELQGLFRKMHGCRMHNIVSWSQTSHVCTN